MMGLRVLGPAPGRQSDRGAQPEALHPLEVGLLALHCHLEVPLVVPAVKNRSYHIPQTKRQPAKQDIFGPETNTMSNISSMAPPHPVAHPMHIPAEGESRMRVSLQCEGTRHVAAEPKRNVLEHVSGRRE